VGRIGGEEFLIILPLNGETDGAAAFETLLGRIGACNLETRSGPLTLTASIGVVRATRDSTVDEILEASDLALYEAKRSGRNRVVFCDLAPQPAEK
jgi:diguanylate cyclase (GGDEF)-like protein